MRAKLISVDAKATTPQERFRPREFKRLVGLAARHRGMLALGLLCTVCFAALHTVSIGTAFPVFKILLEEEGLRAWIDRTIAGQRLQAQFAPVGDDRAIGVVDVKSEGLLGHAGVKPADRLWDAEGRSAPDLVRAIATAEPGSTIRLYTSDPRTATPPPPTVEVTLERLDSVLAVFRQAASLVPAEADQQKLRTLTFILGGLVVLVILGNAFRYAGEVLIAEAVLRAMLSLRSALYERTLQLPMAFFAGQNTADLVGRFVQDIQEIQRGMVTLFSKFLREPLRAAFVLTWAFILDWRITLTLLLVTPLVVAVFWRIGRSVKKSNRKLLQAYGHMIAALTHSLQNLRVVKAYTAEDHERARLRQIDDRVLRQQLKLARLQAFVSPMMETVAVVAGSCLTVWLASRVLSHDIDMATFAALGVALSMLFDPLRKLTDVYVRIMRATAGAERIFHVIDQPTESDLAPAKVDLGPLHRAIEYRDVSYTYPGADVPALDGINLTIHKGETMAIVGPNGSGKTTLVSMLARFFDPDTGKILYDGTDIRQASLKSLRTQIGLVTQEAVVFAGTPIENITYGSPDGDENRARDAAVRARADEFIQAIARGYQTILGERGQTLSGGQRQRLAIARAIFRNAPILIFDEATSQVDSESELKIQTALREFAQGRTTLIIAHRLSTIQFADRIVVMDTGRIIDMGTHAELIQRCTIYRTLCETQFAPEEAEA